MRKPAFCICGNKNADQRLWFRYTPLLYGKTWGYRGIPNFLVFALKHILWVLVRTARVPTIYVLGKNMK